MFKTLTSSILGGKKFHTPLSRTTSKSQINVPLNHFFDSLKQNGNRNHSYLQKAQFSSESDDASPLVIEEKAPDNSVGDEAESKGNSAIVLANSKPEDHLTVVALPLPHRPLFPGFYMPIYVKDKKLLETLVENRKRSVAYAGAFLLKDEPVTEHKSSTEAEKSLTGKELFSRLHEVGTLAQISSINGDQVVLIGHRRLKITEMVEEDPLTVKVDHLKDKPYDKDDDLLKATSSEVISTLRDVLKTNPLWKDHVQTYTQHMGDFNYPRIADFGAAISGANKLLCQEVLEELDMRNILSHN